MTSNTPQSPNSSSHGSSNGAPSNGFSTEPNPDYSSTDANPASSTYALSGKAIPSEQRDGLSDSSGQVSSGQPGIPDGPLADLDHFEPSNAAIDPETAPWLDSNPRPPSDVPPMAPPPTSTFKPPEDPSRGKFKNQPSFEYSQDDINSLRAALQENNVFRLSFYFLDYILRAQTALFEQIHRQQQLPRIIASMSILCAILSAIYGLTMGMDHSLFQSVAAAVKLPLLFVLTAIICIPSLYTFNVLLGQRFKFLQTVTLMVMTLGTTSILLASLAPIAFFFSLTTPQYSFLLLLHVSIFGLCGLYGVQYLYRGCSYLAFRMEQPLNTLLLRIWIVIYALVGMQLGWRLRPFVGSDGSPFQIFRTEQGGNFYIAVWNALSSLLGGG